MNFFLDIAKTNKFKHQTNTEKLSLCNKFQSKSRKLVDNNEPYLNKITGTKCLTFFLNGMCNFNSVANSIEMESMNFHALKMATH